MDDVLFFPYRFSTFFLPQSTQSSQSFFSSAALTNLYGSHNSVLDYYSFLAIQVINRVNKNAVTD